MTRSSSSAVGGNNHAPPALTLRHVTGVPLYVFCFLSPITPPSIILTHRNKTQSCTPNTYAIPLLAPAYDENICPHWAERWEVRTRPLGCQVSTITALSVIIAVLSTLTVVFLIWLILVTTRRLKRRMMSSSTSRGDGEQTWLAYTRSWRIWNPRAWGSTSRTIRNPSTISEQDPLLHASTRNSTS